MNRVSVICTVHIEVEPCITVSVLHNILEHFQPDVIFLEMHSTDFDHYFVNCSQHNLESRAVRRFRENHPQVKLIPVDLPAQTADFISDVRRLDQTVGDLSSEYRELMRLDHARKLKHGFYYLSSDYCNEHWLKAYQETAITVKRHVNPECAGIYGRLVESNSVREKAMVESIEKSLRENGPSNCVFLVGAAHRGA